MGRERSLVALYYASKAAGRLDLRWALPAMMMGGQRSLNGAVGERAVLVFAAHEVFVLSIQGHLMKTRTLRW